MNGPRIRDALQFATQRLKNARIASARLEATAFVAESLGLTRTDLILKAETSVDAQQEERINDLVTRRENGEPFFYILGKREFWSLDFKVGPQVLSPRPETEILLEQFLHIVRNRPADDEPIRLLDIGTGSGCIAICSALEIEQLQVTAVDISTEALRIARGNANHHKVADRIRFVCADLFPSDERELFHFILSNPPYIASEDIPGLPSDIRDYEPHGALDGGRDGLDFYRKIISSAKSRLFADGVLMMEIGETQAEAIRQFASEQGGYQTPDIYKDYAGKDRVMVFHLINPQAESVE
jgi:release factor glutamine methyltransferase